MKLFSSVAALTLILLISSCKKEDTSDTLRTCNPSTDGTLTATLNGKSWTACNFKAVYYSKDRSLSITAIDENSDYELRFFISVDSITPLKQYAINSTGNSGLEIVESLVSGNMSSSDIYFCDLLNPGTGGSFTLTKLDTLSGELAGSFAITGYSQSQTKTITLTNGQLLNVKLIKSAKSYNSSSYISANINGVSWFSRQVYAQINGYVGSPQFSFLNVVAMGYPADLGDCPQYLVSFTRSFSWGNGRSLNFSIPTYGAPGTYPLEANSSSTPISAHYNFNYNHHDYQNLFNPLPGSTISITNIDTAHRNLDINFTAQAKDSTGRLFNFSTGKIHIVNWQPY
ncbi:MAG: hypothetical protein U0X40_11815 [Ferruginibacter sp.]